MLGVYGNRERGVILGIAKLGLYIIVLVGLGLRC